MAKDLEAMAGSITIDASFSGFKIHSDLSKKDGAGCC